MALAATRCFDSLCSCSSVRCSSCGIAASAPTCICILTCRCFATAGESARRWRGLKSHLDLEQLQQPPGEEWAALDLHSAAGYPRQGGAAAPVRDLRDAAHEGSGGQLHDGG